MSRIHASTWVLIGHSTGVSYEPGRTVTSYRTTRVRIDRPESDADFAEFDCGHCDAVLEVRVLSARRAVRLRLLWALLALASLAACIYFAYVGIRAMDFDTIHPDENVPFWAEIGSLFGFGIGGVAFILGLVFAVAATGIRICDDSSGSGRHTLLKQSWSGPDRVTGLP